MAPVLAGGCAHRLGLAPATPSAAFEDTSATRLGMLANRVLQGKTQGQDPGSEPTRARDQARARAPESERSALHLLPGGFEALAARIALIDRAERSVDLQYYIWRADRSGELLARALWRAAERGVRVRLLLDDWGTRPTEEQLGMFAAHPNVEVRLFNPLPVRWWPLLGLLLDFERGNRRMHNKALVADNQAAIVGGRNVGDEYFESQREFTFSDLDVLAVGPVVRQVSAGFDAYWNSALAMPVASAANTVSAEPGTEVAALRKAVEAVDFGRRLDEGVLSFYLGRGVALHDVPDKLLPSAALDPSLLLGHQIGQAIGEPRSELLLVSAYFVPGEGGVAQLRGFRERGIEVTVVTNSLAATDVPVVHAGYVRYRAPLLDAGIELYEIRPDGAGAAVDRAWARGGSSRVSLHAKLMVIDRRTSFVGSMNIDPRSVSLNTENGIVFESAEMAEALVAGAAQVVEGSAYRLELADGSLRWRAGGANGDEVLDTEPAAGPWLSLVTWLLSWLHLDAML